MIRTDWDPDDREQWTLAALEAGGHLSDDVAAVMLDIEYHQHNTAELEELWRKTNQKLDGIAPLRDVLVSEDTALD